MRRSIECTRLYDVRPQGYNPNSACCARLADAVREAQDRASTIKYCAELKQRGAKGGDEAIAYAEGDHGLVDDIEASREVKLSRGSSGGEAVASISQNEGK